MWRRHRWFGADRIPPPAPPAVRLKPWLRPGLSFDRTARRPIIPPMGVRTRGLDIGINAKRQAADAVIRAEAKGVIDRWNGQLATGRDMQRRAQLARPRQNPRRAARPRMAGKAVFRIE